MRATEPYDVAKHLRTPEEMAFYLDACIEEAQGEVDFVVKAFGDVARAHALQRIGNRTLRPASR
jgi:DNA-binding phage protein